MHSLLNILEKKQMIPRLGVGGVGGQGGSGESSGPGQIGQEPVRQTQAKERQGRQKHKGNYKTTQIERENNRSSASRSWLAEAFM